MTTTTLINNEAAFPNATTCLATEAIPTALVLTQTNIMAQIEGDQPTARIAYVSVDPSADIAEEGAEINAKDPTISELVVGTQKVAVLSILSNEAYNNMNMPNMIGNSLARAIVAKADKLFLSAPAVEQGTNNKVIGLANYKGIIDGGKLDGTLDAIIDAMATISANEGTPTTIIAGYDAWAAMLKFKGGDKRALISPDVANSTTPQLFGLPVILSPHMPANTVLIVDNNELVSSVSQVKTATTSDRYFEKDSIGVRGTFRFGFGILHPNRVAKVTTA
ncbi:phage major capsid protein [Gardnerella sp. KA00735]|uniref:phage major capsid protein n=1 Tax=Gardnerella sp. KA00735 TaxID=1973156 RepID=UPI000C9EE707|nr:phage major capsid protein [Gardnerella sp. KA00735]PNP88585.1 hypothetical protein BFS08_04330 [Gardnerella sp. KA00735]